MIQPKNGNVFTGTHSWSAAASAIVPRERVVTNHVFLVSSGTTGGAKAGCTGADVLTGTPESTTEAGNDATVVCDVPMVCLSVWEMPTAAVPGCEGPARFAALICLANGARLACAACDPRPGTGACKKLTPVGRVGAALTTPGRACHSCGA